MSDTETPTELSMRMRLASHKSWAATTDRTARTAAARKASHHTRFLVKARELHPDATDEQLAAVAKSLRSAHYTELALRSAQARRLNAAARRQSTGRNAAAA